MNRIIILSFPSILQLSSKDEIELIEQNRSLTLSVKSIPSGKPVTMSWSVPVDEATHKDWIGEGSQMGGGGGGGGGD